MLDFYTLQEVLKMLTESSNNKYTYTATDIATLCKQGVLTPVFGYAGYAIEVIEDKNTGRNPEWRTTSFYDGHLTNKRLLSLLDKSKNKLELSNAVTYKRDGKSYEVVLVANPLNIHKYLSDDNYSLYSDDDDYTVTRESLLFPSKQVKSYIASKQTAEQDTTEQNTPEQQRIAELVEAKTELEVIKQNNPDTSKNLYTTPAINIMNEVITEFWIDYDPDQPAPKQSTITSWITNNFEGTSSALALNIDKVCRHSSAKSGGKYKR